MIRVFIADDEYMIIEGLTKMVNWSEHGYQVVGDSDNGAKAYQKIKELKPDIVLTDLKMPGMSGLEIIRAARADKLQCKFIIISGYKDFQYCQEALTLGVCDYLLKPIDFTEIIPKLNNISKDFLEDHQRRSAILKRYFASVFCGIAESSEESSRDIADIIEYKYLYNICVIFSKNELKNVEHNFCNFSFYCHFLFRNQYVFIFGEENKKVLEDRVGSFKEYYSFNLTQKTLSAAMSFGGICKFTDIYKAYQTAAYLVDNKVFYGVEFIDAECKNTQCKSTYLKDRVKDCFNGLKEFDNETVNKSLRDFFGFAVLNRLEKALVVGSIRELYIMIENLYDSQCIDLKLEIEKLDRILSIYELKSAVIEMLEQLICSIKSLANDDPIEKIKAYINKYYMNDLSLTSVSGTFFFNPSYLSRLFKEKTNLTFTEYVNKVRINKAKFLLTSSNLNIDKISLQLGYSSYRYFTKTFRKYIGLAPQEYRKRPPQINMVEGISTAVSAGD